jgi:hypothetical protein
MKTRMTPCLYCGTDGSNLASSSGESGANSISWIMVGADRKAGRTLEAAADDGRIRPGGGLSWGASLMHW